MSRRRKSEFKSTNSKRNYIISSFWAIFTVWIVSSWWPEVFAPFKVFGEPFWSARGGLGDWLTPIWFIFAWGIGVNVVVGLAANSNTHSFERFLRRKEEPSAGQILTGGTLLSLFAGVTEELAFRWLIYLSAIAMVVFGNWLWGTVFAFVMLAILGIFLTTLAAKASDRGNILPAILVGMACTVGIVVLAMHGGFLDPVKWLYEALFIPLADFTTFGYLHPYLVTTGSPDAWALGAGVVSANAFFRDGHKYQGPFGVVNAWFIGMVLFWVMFTFGLFPAIVVHFLYDFLIFATVAFMRLFR